MTAICRIPVLENNVLPKLDCTVEDGYMIVYVPTGTPVFDTNELCHYPRCRKQVTIGTHLQRLQYCFEHSEYSRKMQKQNYANRKRKMDAGICVRHGCFNSRAPNKRRPGLGRCCEEHAAMSAAKAKMAYRNNNFVSKNKSPSHP